MTNKTRTLSLWVVLVLLVSMVAGAIPHAAAENTALDELDALFAVPAAAVVKETKNVYGGTDTEYYVNGSLVMARRQISTNSIYSTYLYDAAGNETRRKVENADGKIMGIFRCEKTVHSDGSYETSEIVEYNQVASVVGERHVTMYDANGEMTGGASYSASGDLQSEMHVTVNADGFRIQKTVYAGGSTSEQYRFPQSDGSTTQVQISKDSTGAVTSIRSSTISAEGVYLSGGEMTKQEWINFYYGLVFAAPSEAVLKETENAFGGTDVEYYVNGVLVMARKQMNTSGMYGTELYDAAGNMTRRKVENADGKIMGVFQCEKTVHSDGSYETSEIVEYNQVASAVGDRNVTMYDANGKMTGWASYNASGVLQSEMHVTVNADGFEVRKTVYASGSSYDQYIFPQSDGSTIQVQISKDSTGVVTGIRSSTISAEGAYLSGGEMTEQEWQQFYAEQVENKPHALPDGERLTIPADVLRIEESAFAGCSAAIVEIPDGCVVIGANAFANSGVKHILIPASVTSIADNALAGCTDVIVYGDLNSTAQAFADAHGYTFLKR